MHDHFTPKQCLDVDDCTIDSCQNGGICMDGLNSFTCSCQTGYTGTYCETCKLDYAGQPILEVEDTDINLFMKQI